MIQKARCVLPREIPNAWDNTIRVVLEEVKVSETYEYFPEDISSFYKVCCNVCFTRTGPKTST